jgi:hypothetical protein
VLQVLLSVAVVAPKLSAVRFKKETDSSVSFFCLPPVAALLEALSLRSISAASASGHRYAGRNGGGVRRAGSALRGAVVAASSVEGYTWHCEAGGRPVAP